MKKLLSGTAVVTLVILAAAGSWLFRNLNEPYQGFSEPAFVEVTKGMSTGRIAGLLAEKGVIKSPFFFLAARVLDRGKTLQAGEYQFRDGASVRDIIGRLSRGDTFYLELLIPEGYNIYEIAEAAGKLGIMTPAAFLSEARNPAMIHDLDPAAPTLEGYLFPNKYRVRRHTTPQQLCRMMTAEFRRQWAGLQSAGLKSKETVHAAVTLASLVEREARRPDERSLVASVFHNRLKIGMKLDCDPTTVYAALRENRYRGTIYRSDLASESPWNTYRHSGLPPGPIANPGLGALQAALAPADSTFLYFVAKADGSGGHTFSDSLAKHEAAAARYQRATRH